MKRLPCRDKKLAMLATAALVAAAPVAPVQAARPLNTDDARIVDAGACQLEAWVRSQPGRQERWALPGCNVTGNLELTLGGGRERDDTSSHALALVLQGKTILRPLQTNGMGWGVAVGIARDSINGSNDPYVYLPVTWSLRDDRSFIHLNLGARRDGAGRRTLGTWGLGLEQPLTESVGAIGEVYQQDRSRALFQLGGRFWLVAERVQIDATVGNRLGGGQRWFSLGLRLLTPSFMH